jgi:prephenate dehydrogenase
MIPMVTDSDAYIEPARLERSGESTTLPRLHLSKVVIYGVGLLGGSIGQALIAHGVAEKVVGLGRSLAPLEEARRLEAITSHTLVPDAAIPEDQRDEVLRASLEGAEIIILCTPVEHIRAILPEICRAAPAGAIITDVGSTKARIVEAGEAAARCRNGEISFIGCHPMAGSDRSGVAHARPDLFRGATVYLTPTENSNRDALARLSLLWMVLGGRIILCRPHRHDELAALTSHLPFVASTSVVRSIEASDEDRNLLRAVVAGGFRDTTRIAKGHPDMWRDILRENAPEVRKRIAGLRTALDQLEQAITQCEGGDESLRSLLAENSQFRAWFEEA